MLIDFIFKFDKVKKLNALIIFFTGFSTTNYAEEYYWKTAAVADSSARFDAAGAACKAGAGAYGLAGIQGVSENSFFCSRELDSGFIQGFGYAYRSGDGCKEGQSYNSATGSCDDKDDPDCPLTGNPIEILTGNKIEREVDFIDGSLKFERFFSSQHGWSFSYQQHLSVLPIILSGNTVSYYSIKSHRINGETIAFNGTQSEGYTKDPDVFSNLTALLDSNNQHTGWELSFENGIVETYDLEGKLVSISSQSKTIMQLDYDSVIDAVTVSDMSANKSLTMSLDPDGRVSQLSDPEGNITIYGYNASGELTAVTYPDSTFDINDNPTRYYHYENIDTPSLLTGITDEQGVRYVTWMYDENGRAYLSKNSAPSIDSGVGQVNIDYSFVDDVDDPRVTVENMLGHQTTYHYTTISSVRKIIWVERSDHINSEDSSLGCPTSDQYTSYDMNGFKNIVVDWEGKAIDYDYDSLGREVQRVEGLLTVVDTSTAPPTITTSITPESNTMQTEWHPDFRLPTKITEPDRVTVITYDPVNGRELSRTEYLLGNEP